MLRRKILTLELPPGTALSDNELAASLGVSRTPVRESLILLTEEGLVQVFPQMGTLVSRVDAGRVADEHSAVLDTVLAGDREVPACSARAGQSSDLGSARPSADFTSGAVASGRCGSHS